MTDVATYRMFEQFSRSYYFGRVYVEPYGGDRPVMQREQHERVNQQMYATGEGLERIDHPLVMKVGNRHMAVHADDAVPDRTLAVPEPLLDERIRNPPDLREVFLATADRAEQLARMGALAGI